MSPENQTPSEPTNSNLITVPEDLLLPAETLTKEQPESEVIEVPDFVTDSLEKKNSENATGLDASTVHEGVSYTNESVQAAARSEILRKQAEMAAMSKIAVHAALNDQENRNQ